MAVSETIQRYITNLDYSRDFLADYLADKGVSGVSHNDKIDILVHRLREITTAFASTSSYAQLVPNHSFSCAVTLYFVPASVCTVMKNVFAGVSEAVSGVTFESNPKIMGDANNDGAVTQSDANLALSMATHLITPTPYQLEVCDIDGDGSVSAEDSRRIERIADGLEFINFRTGTGVNSRCFVRSGNT
ncbi:MAG: hypothetical protein GX851_08690 [Clostridiales bacterium]|nr:hypothetical protein [Clostridiales bacterium]